MSDSQSDGIERSEFGYWAHKADEALTVYLEDPSEEKRNLVLEYAGMMDRHSHRQSQFHKTYTDQLKKLDEKDEKEWLGLLRGSTSIWYSRRLAVSPFKENLLIYVDLNPGGDITIWGQGLEQFVSSLLNQANVQRTELWENYMLILSHPDLSNGQFKATKIGGHS